MPAPCNGPAPEKHWYYMIFIGLGANLPSEAHGTPLATCEAALDALAAAGVKVRRRSRWYRSAPQPASDQPWFVNGVAEVAAGLVPADLLALMHRIETDFGRRPGAANAARVIDLDLLAYGQMVSGAGAALRLPHPRLHERAFVLYPLAELAPRWRHPATGHDLETLISALDGTQRCEPMEDAPETP